MKRKFLFSTLLSLGMICTLFVGCEGLIDEFVDEDEISSSILGKWNVKKVEMVTEDDGNGTFEVNKPFTETTPSSNCNGKVDTYTEIVNEMILTFDQKIITLKQKGSYSNSYFSTSNSCSAAITEKENYDESLSNKYSFNSQNKRLIHLDEGDLDVGQMLIEQLSSKELIVNLTGGDVGDGYMRLYCEK